jgi:hypothetical protein
MAIMPVCRAPAHLLPALLRAIAIASARIEPARSSDGFVVSVHAAMRLERGGQGMARAGSHIADLCIHGRTVGEWRCASHWQIAFEF